MSSRHRFVFDTNTLVSAVLFEHSKPGQAFRRALQVGSVVLSPSTLDELTEVLERDKFDRYLTPSEREEFLEGLLDRAMVVEPTDTIRECRDPNDEKFLELAVSANASHVVTGDVGLLVLHPFREVEILTPDDFLKAMAGDTHQ